MALICNKILLGLVSTVVISSSGWLSWDRGAIVDAEIEEVFAQPDLLDQAVRGEQNSISQNEISPLLQQAIQFALYLDPPEPKVMKPFFDSAEPKLVKPMVPKHVTPKFVLLVTSVHPVDVNQSMALIEEPGARKRWVRKGTHVGHQVVEVIEKGRLLMKFPGVEKCDEVLISRDEKTLMTLRESSYRIVKKTDLPKKYQGREGIPRLRFGKND